MIQFTIDDIQFKRGTASRWTALNLILDEGELGFEKDTGKFKVGDGEARWNDLPYYLNEDDISDLIEGQSVLPPGGTDGQVLGKSGASTTWLSVGTSGEIDTKIALHDQAEEVHNNATSGRDFVALFQNGLI